MQVSFMALSFNNGKFRILQVSDPQDMHYPRHSMLKMLDKAYDTLNPDLVVFTGDNVLSNHLLDARFGNKKVAEGKGATLVRMRKSLAIILEPLQKRNIPFGMIFGNSAGRKALNLGADKEYILKVAFADTDNNRAFSAFFN